MNRKTEPKYQVGQTVSLRDWNRAERVKMCDVGIIGSIRKDKSCQSGFMYRIIDNNSAEVTLDEGWLKGVHDDQA